MTPAKDTLDTVGTILTGDEGRDAVHIAMTAAIAHCRLLPGDWAGRVGPDVGGLPTVGHTGLLKLLGVVDPFLIGPVEKGQKFFFPVRSREGNPDLDICNTRSTSLAPQPVESMHDLDGLSGRRVDVKIVIPGEDFERYVNYKVMVEMWDKAKVGRVRRLYEAQLTPAERNTANRYYARFYRWYFVSGTPLKVLCHLRTLERLKKIVAFFGSI